MPNITYIKLSDYYNCWLGQDLKITNNNDSTYEVKVPIGTTGTIDINKDTISTDDVLQFYYPKEFIENDTSDIYTFVKGTSQTSEPVSYTCDLSEYNIDIRGDENEVWYPAATLCDLYDITVMQGDLIDDNLYFFYGILSPYSRTNMISNQEHIDSFTEKYKNGRPKDLVEFNYNEICFNFDQNYGFPGRFVYNDLLAETNFDTMLSTASEGTKKIKEMLLSEDVYEYCAGYDLLNDYFWDGGHTVFYDTMIATESDFADKVNEKLSLIGSPEDANYYKAIEAYKLYSGQSAFAARNEMLETADTYEDLGRYAAYAVKGDTAFFSFLDFYVDSDKWKSYYFKNDEMPQDLVSQFYNCVTKANEDPAIKNFVIDLGANRGDSSDILDYMMGLICDLDNYNISSGSGNVTGNIKYSVDKNLDKVYDEKDKAVKFDLNFGIITSNFSFSCANLMPSLAKENGIMLVGETSGGGTCATNCFVTPDGLLYALSIGQKFVDKDGNSIDNGIKPDYDIVKVNDDGTKDYSEVYNFSKLSSLFNEFYGKKSETEPSVTTTTSTTLTTTSATTTTTTATSTTSSSSTSTSTTTTSSSSTTSNTTTANSQNNGDLPNTGNNSVGTAAAAASAFVMVIAGGFLIFISRKNKNKDDKIV
ncbi:S41 family peptidase [Ruminococcus sp.]|jgi:LPXTG-motif cell wall-anchored protein|uniref:S41 family peptidase n=1 Tax=Ruminococcus sp. TaxID=41978 RepID=UPI0025E5C9F5|nr:S41 family peptidase [Ruminococcus sp.]